MRRLGGEQCVWLYSATQPTAVICVVDLFVGIHTYMIQIQNQQQSHNIDLTHGMIRHSKQFQNVSWTSVTNINEVHD
jgi:hypothetical protein